MEIYEYLDQMKEIHELLIQYADNENNDDKNFKDFIEIISSQKILENINELRTLIHLIVRLCNNHHCDHNFIMKIEKILIFFQKDIKNKFTNFEIFDLFKRNKRILLFLFKNKTLLADESIFKFLHQKSDGENTVYSTYLHFFYTEFKSFIKKEKLSIDISEHDYFDEKRQTGENDSLICELIRKDSIEEFVKYVNRKNISLLSTINHSIFETNLFLMKNETTLIQYAAFFGSIQIFQFLRLNNVRLSSSLWLYSIHGRNAEIIHILEEDHIKPGDKTFENCLEEAIKCHHVELIDYFKDNILRDDVIDDAFESNFWRNPIECCFHYYNIMFFPEEFDSQYMFYYACKFDYYKIVELLINENSCDINLKIILNCN